MKTIFLLLALFLFFGCDSILDDSVEKTGDLSFYSDGGGDGIYEGALGASGDDGQSIVDSINAGQITAGEWNDLANWDFWNDLFQTQEYADILSDWKCDVSKRISVKLTDNAGNLVVDKEIFLKDKENETIWTAKTDYQGVAELWPSLSTTTNSIDEMYLLVDGTKFENLKLITDGVNTISLPTSFNNTLSNKVDIAFVVDATGSMGDELEYLKVELVDVIDSVKETNNNATINMASVFYRDEGDDYVVKSSNFSTNSNTTISFIKKQSAAGGGDFPEAVHSALNEAINNLTWSSNVNSRILFLLLDAPPHSDAQIVDQIHSLVKKASEKGIKIIPITASGIDKSTEFLMRYFSITTNGSYVFITNHSGIGGEHIEPTIGEYQVEYLNHLMVRLINNYL